MVIIVDNTEKSRKRELRSRFLNLNIPCAVCTADSLKKLAPARFTVVFAESESMLTTVSIRAGATELIAVNVTGKPIRNPDAYIIDPSRDTDVVNYVIRRAREAYLINALDPDATPVRFDGEYTFFRNRHLRLTPDEKMILRHLVLSKGEYHTPDEIARYCFAAPSARDLSRVRTHICNINRKALTAADLKLIIAVRGKGYKVDFPNPDEREKTHYNVSSDAPLFV